MKVLKKIAVLSMALMFCFGAGAMLTACGDSKDNSSSVEQAATAYEFIVLNADGTPAKNVSVQLCTLGNEPACYMPITTDANGKVTYNPIGFPGEGEYEIHLLNQDLSASLEFNGPVTTPTISSKITLTLK